ncbi:hypothetical protein [Nocardia blacklockiae]|uniref:hypothetical protein n=1 Tax=Nocardia blacklockiae TaxID=480036 RepID=UPI00189351E7|nr:hypothetical protein [Nocardia blacklockiae]MBF6174395.1 hypothetical protein [Nocardia blacklockiae]
MSKQRQDRQAHHPVTDLMALVAVLATTTVLAYLVGPTIGLFSAAAGFVVVTLGLWFRHT